MGSRIERQKSKKGDTLKPQSYPLLSHNTGCKDSSASIHIANKFYTWDIKIILINANAMHRQKHYRWGSVKKKGETYSNN